MRLSEELLPNEILRKLRAFFTVFREDLDFRYPEVRRRWELELDLETTPSSKIASIFDFFWIMRWHETYRQRKAMKRLRQALAEPSTSELCEMIFRELKELAQDLDSHLESTHPIATLMFRWRMEPKRQAVEYYFQLVHHRVPKENSIRS